MKFWRWIFKVPVDEHDWKTEAELARELREALDTKQKWQEMMKGFSDKCVELTHQIQILEKEVCHWKSIALNFKKFHQ